MTPSAAPDERIYLDHNATSPLRPQVRAAMEAALAVSGNPSSVHAEGRAARALIETARAQVASAVGRRPRDVVFTSGGTEAANFTLSPALGLSSGGCDRLLAGAGEHACVLSGHRFPAGAVELLPLRADGVLDLEALAGALERRAGRPSMVALQAANNETGVVQPVREAGRLARAHGGLLICDAVQALGRISCHPCALDAEVLLLSAHKIGGPKGVGALVFEADRLHMGEAFVRGGGQERGFRGGTENVPGIVGFGVACEEAVRSLESEAARLSSLRDALEHRLCSNVPGLVVFGAGSERLPNTSAFAAPGVKAETLVIALDLAGAAVSSGSACSSGKVKPSHVLAAMGVASDLATGALRVSLGWSTCEKDVTVFCEIYEKTLRSIGSRRIGRAA